VDHAVAKREFDFAVEHEEALERVGASVRLPSGARFDGDLDRCELRLATRVVDMSASRSNRSLVPARVTITSALLRSPPDGGRCWSNPSCSPRA
jgi:hypothetical protein